MRRPHITLDCDSHRCRSLFLAAIVSNPIKAADPESQRHVVEIRNLEFTPKELVAALGDTITWVNYDLVPHTVTADDESWDPGFTARKGNGRQLAKRTCTQPISVGTILTMTAGLRIVRP